MIDVFIFVFGSIVTLVVTSVTSVLLLAARQDGRRERVTRLLRTSKRELLGALESVDSSKV